MKLEKIVFVHGQQKIELTPDELQGFKGELDRLVASFVQPNQWFYVKEKVVESKPIPEKGSK